MSLQPVHSAHPARPAAHPPKSTRSGEHPAVQAYRAKLESVDAGATAATSELDLALQEFLADLKTPVPPKL